jgi:hypothetical protein
MKPTKEKYYHRTFKCLAQMKNCKEKPVSYAVNKYTGAINAKFKM